MLDDLSSGSWLLLVGCLIIGGFIYAWVADAVLGRNGFGVILSTIISAFAGYGGLRAMDWAVQTHRIPYDWQVPAAWGAAAVLGAMVTLMVLSLLKRAFVR